MVQLITTFVSRLRIIINNVKADVCLVSIKNHTIEAPVHRLKIINKVKADVCLMVHLRTI